MPQFERYIGIDYSGEPQPYADGFLKPDKLKKALAMEELWSRNERTLLARTIVPCR
jgi:hypothetical protein